MDQTDLESTAVLLENVRNGDAAATERLIARYIDPLRRIARRELPRCSRDLCDTDDLVFPVLHNALRRVERGAFVPRGEGAFLAYLRTCLRNAVADEKKKMRRRPRPEDLSTDIPDSAPSPLMDAIGRQDYDLFQQALDRLPERKHQAVILRIEFGYSYEDIAAAVRYSTASAARMAVARALLQIAEWLDGR
jgi:RNA polymerase sigma-70 factor (ECF subfamily)